MQAISDVSFEAGHCPNCGEMREVIMTHMITGDEAFLDRTLLSVGVPPLHVIRANNGVEYRFYELSGDLPTSLHFSHFEDVSEEVENLAAGRIRLGKKIRIKDSADGNESRGRIRLKD